MDILILEDDPMRMVQFRKRIGEHRIVHVETAAGAIEALGEHRFDLVLLDHDLGGRQFADHGDEKEDCGMRVAEWLSEEPRRMKTQGPVVVHSLNGPAAQEMVELITEACWIPFLWNQDVWAKFMKFPTTPNS